MAAEDLTPDPGRPSDALMGARLTGSHRLVHFLRNALGTPARLVAPMRLLPMWKDMKALAEVLPNAEWTTRRGRLSACGGGAIRARRYRLRTARRSCR